MVYHLNNPINFPTVHLLTNSPSNLFFETGLAFFQLPSNLISPSDTPSTNNRVFDNNMNIQVSKCFVSLRLNDGRSSFFSFKGIIHILFNVVSLILTIPSLAFYGKAVTHYHKIRTGKITVTCEKKYSHDNCNEKYESLATTAAALYGLLLVANLVEIVLSMFLCAMSASFRCFCKKVFLSADSAHISEVRILAIVFFVRKECFSLV